MTGDKDIDSNNITTDPDNITIGDQSNTEFNIDLTDTAGTRSLDFNKKPIFRIIGDMVYFKDIEKCIPLRKISTKLKKQLGIIK